MSGGGTAVAVMIGVLLAPLAGCGGCDDDDGRADASVGDGGQGDGGSPDGGAAAGRKLLPGGWQLLGLHGSACSHGASSSAPGAPRWCALSRPGTTLGTFELWVLDVTRAAASAAPASCQGEGNADCVRLSTNLFAGQPDSGPAFPTAHRFYGDTLIYYANGTSSGSELYQGPVFAWKPGWVTGRPITSDKGLLCSGHARADVAVCLENISAPGVQPVSWDLHAGRLDAGALKKVATIFPVHPVSEASQWSSGFSASGDQFLFSTPTSGNGQAAETLFQVRTDDIGTATPTVVAVGATRWSLSASESRLFYLKDYNYDQQGGPSGTLYMRDFPASASETRLLGTLVPGGATAGVGAYQVLVGPGGEDAGLGLLVGVAAGQGQYRWLKDPAASLDDPANVVTVIEDARAVPAFSPDLRFYILPRSVGDAPGTGDSWIVKSDGTGSCALGTSASGSLMGPAFTADSSLVFWMQGYDPATDTGQAWLANPDGCAGKRSFASGVDFWFVDGARSLLYSDDGDGRRVSLRYAPIQQGQLGAATVLQRGADRMYAILAGHSGVVYSLSGRDDSGNGIYYQPLPPP